MAKEVVLHIGSGKTGTSTIQRFLADHHDDLLADGVLYPRSYGGVRHTHLSNASRPDEGLTSSLTWRRARFTEPAAYRSHHAARLAAELAETSPERVLFSDEGLYALGPVPLGNLRANLDSFAEQRTIVVYLRRQEDHLVSRYQQSVKTGAVETLVAFAQRDHTNIYDYARRLRIWSEAMAPARVVVRRFEPARFEGGSLLTDFVAATGLAVDVPAEAGERRNESLDAEAVELLRLLNLDAVENAGERPGSIENRPVVEALAARPRGAVLTLPDADLDAFGERWAPINDEVAAAYLDGAQLFAPARRSSNATTVQGLAPARVEELLRDIGIAAERRARVATIAEREAARGH